MQGVRWEAGESEAGPGPGAAGAGDTGRRGMGPSLVWPSSTLLEHGELHDLAVHPDHPPVVAAGAPDSTPRL